MSASPSSETTPASGPDAGIVDRLAEIDKIENDLLGSEDSIKFFATAQRIHPQARTLARFRFETQPESITEVALAVGVLYGAFIGLPAVAAIWAAWKIWHGGY